MIKFTKMHGLGNDFIVIDAINQQLHITPAQIAEWSRRDIGIGFDQCLLIEKSPEPSIDFFYRIFNANGQEVGQCGNGARCLARFAYHYGLTSKNLISVATYTTKMQLQINDDETVTVNMGLPKLNPQEIPLNQEKLAKNYELTLKDGGSHPFHAINVGNPHAVSVVAKLDDALIEKLGQQISESPLFPEQCNAGFMQIIDRERMKLRVYERGCGETQACGSGAVAAAAIGRLYYDMAERIKVSLLGGELTVDWPEFKGPIYLTGPACFVYEGVMMSCAL